MSRQVSIIIGVIVVLAILGIGAYVMSNKSANPSPAPQTSAQPAASVTSDSSTKGTLKSLLTSGKNVTCTFTYPDQTGSGTVYISSPKFRGDFSVKVEGKEMMSHMIQDNGTAYMWTDGSTQGTKFKMDLNASPAPNASTQAADLNKEVDMKCSDWAVDNSKFAIPTNIQFADLSQMMNTQGQSGAAPKMDKSICDQIQDPQAKAACLKAL